MFIGDDTANGTRTVTCYPIAALRRVVTELKRAIYGLQNVVGKRETGTRI